MVILCKVHFLVIHVLAYYTYLTSKKGLLNIEFYIAKGATCNGQFSVVHNYCFYVSGYPYLGLITVFLLEKLYNKENAQEFPSLYVCLSDLKQSEVIAN